MDQAPRYVSLNSADIILSEVRPTRIRPEALNSVNLLIDEVLWLILNSARSLATERLSRDGLLRILPTTLGKEALLEAEIELKAYWDRTDPIGRGTNVEQMPKSAEFPLQAAFELMRFKCEVYSTLGDADDDAEEEGLLQNRMMFASPSPPTPASIPPAALYITAILEHICEHVLSNVAKVVARDSSRTSAHVQDLYVALCEDDMIYPLFKRMKVKEDLEAQNKALSMPRRSKSISVHTRTSAGISDSQSPPDLPTTPQSARISESQKGRNSNESGGSQGGPSGSPPRNSNEKNRLRMFGSVRAGTPSSQHEKASLSGHRRTGSASLVMDERRADHSNAVDQPQDVDEDFMSVSTHDFDNMLNSGTTMKASLTPDRLRSFEILAKQKAQRKSRSDSTSSVPPPLPSSPPDRLPENPTVPQPSNSTTSSPLSSTVSSPSKPLVHKVSRSGLIPRSAQVKVEAIEEDEDENLLVNGVPGVDENGRMANGIPKPRSRTQSLAQILQEAPPWETSTPDAPPAMKSPATFNGRQRAHTATSGTTPILPPKAASAFLNGRNGEPGLANSSTGKGSQYVAKKKSGLGRSASFLSKSASTGAVGSPANGMSGAEAKMAGVRAPKRAPARNLEDMDLDSLMADDDETEEATQPPSVLGPPAPLAVPQRNKSSAALSSHSPVSASTKEMMDFLSQGPPPSPPRAPTGSAASISSKKAGGRLGRMMAKLARSGSTDQINGAPYDGNGTLSSRRNMGIPAASTPPKPVYALPKPPRPPPVLSPTYTVPSAVLPTPVRPPTAPENGVRPAAIGTSPSPTLRKPAAATDRPATTGTDRRQEQAVAQERRPPVSQAPVQSHPTASGSTSTVPDDFRRPPGLEEFEPVDNSSLSTSNKETTHQDVSTATSPIAATFQAQTISKEVATESSTTAEKAVGPSAAPNVQVVETILAPPDTALVTYDEARRLRDMIGKATSVQECGVLVEMFLAQWGLPRQVQENLGASPDQPIQSHASSEEVPIVDLLLGEGEATGVDGQIDDSDTDETHDAELETPNPQTNDLLSSPRTVEESELPYVESEYGRKMGLDVVSTQPRIVV